MQLITVGPPVRLYGAFVANVSDAPKADSKLVAQSKQQMYYVPGPTSSLAVMLNHGMSRNSKEKNCRFVLAWALRGDLFAPTGLLLVTQRPVQPGLLLKRCVLAVRKTVLQSACAHMHACAPVSIMPRRAL